MRESKDFSNSDSQLQLLSDRGHCAEYSYLNGQLSPRVKGSVIFLLGGSLEIFSDPPYCMSKIFSDSA